MPTTAERPGRRVRAPYTAAVEPIDEHVTAPDGEPEAAPARGWYVDPNVAAQLRWFDGERWTEHTAPMPPTVPARIGGPRTHPLAVASLVCSLAALLTCGIGAFAGVILGHVARGRIKASDGADTGSGLALAGLAIGYLVIAGLVTVAGILLTARS